MAKIQHALDKAFWRLLLLLRSLCKYSITRNEPLRDPLLVCEGILQSILHSLGNQCRLVITGVTGVAYVLLSWIEP